jgi:hypothetical protein
MTNNFPYKKIKGELYWLDAKSKTGWSNREEMKEEFDKKDQIFPSVGRIDTQTH